jgi:spermidine synthase
MNLSTPALRRGPLAALMLILFVSGFCSLVYQTVWIREFRLVFGGAAPAAAAVLAVFMGGLGFGGKIFGTWVERVGRPCRFYARIEFGITLGAVLSPLLLGYARHLYLQTGGAASLGIGTATMVQLLITALVLGIPCFLMGGSLPAAMKFIQSDADPRRSTTALFYAINVAGAVTGAGLGTFYLLPTFGNHATLLIAGLTNGIIALGAGFISNRLELQPRPAPTLETETELATAASHRKAPVPFVLAAAFVSGFSFFVIELLWYRLSTPLLGGSVYGFGLVLCVALAGIGLGGFIYAMVLKKVEPGLGTFTLVSALQAAAVLIPYALGDKLAYLALILNESLRGFGFVPLVAGWSLVVGLMAFLPSLLSGIQFPLLVSLLGSGNRGVGRQLGQAYLWNTIGSIGGSLLGGFILMPWLGAVQSLLVMAFLIMGMSILSFIIDLTTPSPAGSSPNARSSLWRAATLVSLASCLAMASWPVGPTSAWLHQPIGYGRIGTVPRNALSFEAWRRNIRRQHIESYDGKETSVALIAANEFSFLTNGKSDGSAVSDAATQVMLGITPAALHPSPSLACVVGLGTGTTAGWLADVPGMERVDVLELEPEIEKLARHFDPVSRAAMQHPKVNRITGDAREFLLTRGQSYDLIISEPSNPCRAGVANLYTREFYHNASQRLQSGGLFCQWLQGYEVDAATVKTVVSTLSEVFKKVEIWSAESADMLLVCSVEDHPWDLASLRSRIQLPPISEAIQRFWFTDSAEGFMAACLGNGQFCRELASGTDSINTDDHNILEFNFARSIRTTINCPQELTLSAASVGLSLPRFQGDEFNAALYAEERLLAGVRLWSEVSNGLLPKAYRTPETDRRTEQLTLLTRQNWQGFISATSTHPAPDTLANRWHTARALALGGKDGAATALDALPTGFTNDVMLLKAINHGCRDEFELSTLHFAEAFLSMRQNPWTRGEIAAVALTMIDDHAADYAAIASHDVFDLLAEPFSVHLVDNLRLQVRTKLAKHLSQEAQTKALSAWGPFLPWDGLTLALRVKTFMETNDPQLGSAMAEMARFLDQGGSLDGTLSPFYVIPSATLSATSAKNPSN